MKNKNGFTLIELLAVIVILAIIALIATPIVLNMINSARKKAAESSAYGFIDAIEYNNGFAQTEQAGYTEINGTDLDVTSETFNNLKLKGKKPSSGKVTIVNGKVTSANLCVEGYTVTYVKNEVTDVDKGCGGSNSNSESTPVVNGPILNEVIEVGDYVRMTPNPSTLDSQGRYLLDENKIGYNAYNQYIYPKELTLWRVIRKNDNGTIDLVSEYTTSTSIYLKGSQAYANLVGYLNTVAKQYENSKYTSGSRYVGYYDQTETILDTSAFDGTKITPTWTDDTGDTPNIKSPNEAAGQGDTRYSVDLDLIKVAYGNQGDSSLIALKCNDTSCSNPTVAQTYWLASREYNFSISNTFMFGARFVWNDGTLSSTNLCYCDDGCGNYGNSYAFRPIIVLKSGLIASDATGTKDNPFVLS